MSERPVLLIIAGPNGSGKSTLTRQLRATGIDLGTYINPDDIATTLAGTYEARVATAQQQADALRQACLSRQASFSFETVMSHPSKIDVLKQARALGYANLLYFVGTEHPELNIERVRQRVLLGGHDVPHDRIVQRYSRTMKLLPDAIAECDRVLLFDNTYRITDGSPVLMTPFLDLLRRDGKLALLARDVFPDWFDPIFQAMTRSGLL